MNGMMLNELISQHRMKKRLYMAPKIQKTAIKSNIISLYNKTTTLSNIFYYGPKAVPNICEKRYIGGRPKAVCLEEDRSIRTTKLQPDK